MSLEPVDKKKSYHLAYDERQCHNFQNIWAKSVHMPAIEQVVIIKCSLVALRVFQCVGVD